MNPRIFISCILLLLTGCATEIDPRTVVHLGDAEQTLVERWGTPIGSYVAEDGSRYLTYISREDISGYPAVAPNAAMPFGMLGSPGSHTSCKTVFQIKDGRIINFTREGVCPH